MEKSKNTWVDLGLPSGTKWKAQNEKGYYTYDEAVSQFGDALPTKVQLDELRQKCSWEWDWLGAGYKVTGPNGNSITLPAYGWCNDSGEIIRFGEGGYYRTSLKEGKHFAYSFFFSPRCEAELYKDVVYNKQSVRLCKLSFQDNK